MLKQRLKYLRNSHNLTQQQLANEIGSAIRTIQQYELDERKPNYVLLIRLADYFDVSLDYLTGRSDKQEINK